MLSESKNCAMVEEERKVKFERKVDGKGVAKTNQQMDIVFLSASFGEAGTFSCARSQCFGPSRTTNHARKMEHRKP